MGAPATSLGSKPWHQHQALKERPDISILCNHSNVFFTKIWEAMKGFAKILHKWGFKSLPSPCCSPTLFHFGIQSIWSILCLIIWPFSPFITFKFQSRFHLFSEVGEEMTEACWLFSFSTRSAVSSALINSSNEVNEEFELVALKSATSFWPQSSCSEDARSGLKCLRSGALTCLVGKNSFSDGRFIWRCPSCLCVVQ